MSKNAIIKIKFVLFSLLFLLLSKADVRAMSAGVVVPEEYTNVTAGERLYFEIDLKYPENKSRKDLKLNYQVLSASGNVVVQSKVLKAIDTQSSYIDFLVIPENTESGSYTINIGISDYEDLEKEISSTFNIVGTKSPFETYFVVLLVGISVVGVLTAVDVGLKIKRELRESREEKKKD